MLFSGFCDVCYIFQLLEQPHGAIGKKETGESDRIGLNPGPPVHESRDFGRVSLPLALLFPHL